MQSAGLQLALGEQSDLPNGPTSSPLRHLRPSALSPYMYGTEYATPY